MGGGACQSLGYLQKGKGSAGAREKKRLFKITCCIGGHREGVLYSVKEKKDQEDKEDIIKE